uniref:Uncharacterized protein n=1 Tax=Callorhinchus milii TaxID=7868 RepID=A0A4W3IQX8_CALMI
CCCLCGVDLEAASEFKLHVHPPGRHDDSEPFFPFLAFNPEAPRSRPADPTGLVSTCVLCYHDLLEQWWEGKRNSQQPSSSPWSRQYKVDTFICFFCRQVIRRYQGLKSVNINRLPVFLYAPRVANALMVDNGKELTIGTCEDCRTLVLAGHCLKNGSQSDVVSPSSQVKGSSSSFDLSAANKSLAALGSPPGRDEASRGTRHSTPDAVSIHSPQRSLDAGSSDQESTSR